MVPEIPMGQPADVLVRVDFALGELAHHQGLLEAEVEEGALLVSYQSHASRRDLSHT